MSNMRLDKESKNLLVSNKDIKMPYSKMKKESRDSSNKSCGL